MVIQKAVDSMKDKSNDEKKVVAGGLAIAVVSVLFIGWAILFFKKVQSGQQLQSLGGGAQNEFISSSVRDAQKELMNDFSDVDELRQVREQSGNQYQQGVYQDASQQNSQDSFGGSSSIE